MFEGIYITNYQVQVLLAQIKERNFFIMLAIGSHSQLTHINSMRKPMKKRLFL